MFRSTKTISEYGRKREREVCKEDRDREMKTKREESKMEKTIAWCLQDPVQCDAIITIHMFAKCDGWYSKQVLKQTHCTWSISRIYYMCFIFGFVAASLHNRYDEKTVWRRAPFAPSRKLLLVECTCDWVWTFPARKFVFSNSSVQMWRAQLYSIIFTFIWLSSHESVEIGEN